MQEHKLTVTAISFSPDGEEMLSVSRDRTWVLYKYNKDENLFKKQTDSTNMEIKHSRIIWGCSWSYDGKYFGTGSRDNTVIVWKKENNVIEGYKIKFNESITSLAFKNSESYMLIVGTEIGEIFIVDKIGLKFECIYSVPKLYLKIIKI